MYRSRQFGIRKSSARIAGLPQFLIIKILSNYKKSVTIQVSKIQTEKDLLLGNCEANMRGRDAEPKATGMYLRRFV